MRLLLTAVALLAGCHNVFQLDEVNVPDGRGPDVDALSLEGWSIPEVVAELDGIGSESDVSLTDDGLEVYFAANPSGGAFTAYRATRLERSAPFGIPTAVSDLAGVPPFGH